MGGLLPVVSFGLPSVFCSSPYARQLPGLGWMVSPSVLIQFFFLSLFLGLVYQPRNSGIRYMSNGVPEFNRTGIQKPIYYFKIDLTFCNFVTIYIFIVRLG